LNNNFKLIKIMYEFFKQSIITKISNIFFLNCTFSSNKFNLYFINKLISKEINLTKFCKSQKYLS